MQIILIYFLGLPFTSLLQACDKPVESSFVQANFRLYCTVYPLKSVSVGRKIKHYGLNSAN